MCVYIYICIYLSVNAYNTIYIYIFSIHTHIPYYTFFGNSTVGG